MPGNLVVLSHQNAAEGVIVVSSYPNNDNRLGGAKQVLNDSENI